MLSHYVENKLNVINADVTLLVIGPTIKYKEEHASSSVDLNKSLLIDVADALVFVVCGRSTQWQYYPYMCCWQSG